MTRSARSSRGSAPTRGASPTPSDGRPVPHLVRPDVKAFATVGPEGEAALEHDLLAVVERAAHRRGDAIAIPAEYLEVVAVRR